MKTRKLLCLGLAVMLACPMLPQMPVHAQETIAKEGMARGDTEEIAFMESRQGETGGFKIEDGVLVKYTGTEADVEVPAGVTSIGIGAFQSNSNMVSIRMPDSVAEIGNGAFVGCGNLKIIQFSDHLSRIGDGAFYECDSLETISFPESLSVIGEDSFYSCWKLTDLLIPGNVKAIGDRAFAKCSRLTSVMISEGVEDIGAQAFYRCMDLKSVTIPDSVRDIAVNAFEMIGGLTIYGSEGSYAQAYAAENGISFSSNTESKPEMFDIRDGVLVGYHGNVPNVVIPEGVTSIGDSVFEDVRYEAGENVYGEKFNIQTVVIPEGVTNIGKNAFRGCKNLVSITIPSSVTSIGSTAFWKTGWLEHESMENPLVIVNNILVDGDKASGNVVVPEGVTSITGGAFSGCKKLTGISLPPGLQSIEEYAFSMCEGLTGISLPAGLVSIGAGAFYNCINVENIEIPSGATDIGNYAFRGTKWLEGRRAENPLVIVNHILIDGQTSSGNIIIPDGVTEISGGAFEECSALTGIQLPQSVKNIRYAAFKGCRNLTGITIPESVTSIDDGAFSECGKLIIFGKEGSYAQTFAKQAEIPFSIIGGVQGDNGNPSCSHTWNTATTKATTAQNGSITKTCTKCGQKISETIYAPKTIALSKASLI